MSETGRRRPVRTRLALSVHRLGARTTAVLTGLTLGAAVVVPAAMVPGAEPAREQSVRRAAAGTLVNAPTDQIRSREWHLKAMRAQNAWKYSRGRGVTIAVLDTGVDQDHPDLIGHVINGPDLTGGVRRPGSRYWGLHGTSMASIISGHGHGPGLSQGMVGVAPLSHVLSVRVTLENDDPLRQDNGQQGGTGDHDAVAQGIRYAVDHGADIINMSLGGGRQFYNGTKSQESAIKYALSKGVVLIASAGNDGSGANRKNFPAAYPGVIAVGALDRRLRLWKDSNRRSHAAVCAPGVDIVSADASNGYVVGTGTSASSAMVAGVAALVRARYPKLTPAEVRQALIQGSPARSGRPTGSPNCRGTVDALRTLIAAHHINKTSSGPVQTQPVSPAPAPTPAAESPAEESGVLFPIVLGGGGLLIVLGLVLGWRQRRRPEEDAAESDAVPEYRLPSAPTAAPEPAAEPAAVASAEAAAPVNAPLWQNTQAYQGPLPEPDPRGTEPPDAEETPPVEVSWDTAPPDPGRDGTSWDAERPPGLVQEPPPTAIEPKQPRMMPHELRPFFPGEHAPNGTNGHDKVNGHGFANGHHANGHHANGRNGADLNDAKATADDDWEAFRRSAFDMPDAPEPGTAPLPAVSPEPADDATPPPVPPPDERSTGPFPAAPPADHDDEEDYRPPWW